MSYNLDDKVVQKLKNFFQQFDFIDKIVLFGSRAKNTNNPKSDIDLCIFSKTMDKNEFSKLRLEIDELPILYHIDIVHFQSVDNELKDNILKDGKLLI
ncbi:MAG: nucleotidyltransferase domain-containing protein [Campylobacterota bacterium]|nr:nucleotidyltransferase domain-containing protein [Campylobacterota bacterium]